MAMLATEKLTGITDAERPVDEAQAKMVAAIKTDLRESVDRIAEGVSASAPASADPAGSSVPLARGPGRSGPEVATALDPAGRYDRDRNVVARAVSYTRR